MPSFRCLLGCLLWWWVLLYLLLLGGFAVLVVVLVHLGCPALVAVGIPGTLSVVAARAVGRVKHLCAVTT